MANGTLYIIAAASGTGKTSLVKAILAKTEATIGVSISHTTRTPRAGEKQGKDYHFVSQKVFQDLITQGGFLEYAQVFDNFYGTAQSSVEASLATGKDLILEIDWQGARQVRAAFPKVCSIFILPPSNKTLRSRLQSRGLDSEEVITRRMQDAVSEMSHYNEFDYLIINDNFELAKEEILIVIKAGRLRRTRQTVNHAELVERLLAEN